ncbi:hypothetical protein B0T09DRAFT_387659 [Sordaria sp. MPI-SDFR-AT-0083]|nr:hypothetical protein B0T09DRAFT_387659 [Sordaria sp. MPI-SDFR-AT-0083]
MGKVHGSLARKVQSQTPKVEARRSPQTPKGRAHKRENAYTRRFGQRWSPAPGGKRKMNANPTA